MPLTRGEGAGNGRRKRVLIVNGYFDHLRQPGPRPRAVPQALVLPFLAGQIAPDRCEIRTWSEHAQGPLLDPGLLGWPDLLVLTGLTNAFDRLLHLTAYARTLNPRVIVAAGGPAVRALPRHARRFFDYACTGDAEELGRVVEDAFGPGYRASEPFPRFDLAPWFGPAGYAESSRYCNYRCTFCSLTGEGRAYRPYPVEFMRRQVLALGRRRYLLFLDNNFYGNDREFFRARMEALRKLYEEKRFRGWGALVTSDFFLHDENLRLAREAGCGGLFTGLESFDTATLTSFKKPRSPKLPQLGMIRRCLEAGIAFLYGVVFDFTSRTVAEMTAEIDFIVDNPEIPLPNYFSPAIPLLGTPFFREKLASGEVLPRAKLRDFDTTTLTLRPKDDLAAAAAFLRDLPTLRRFRRRVPRRTLGFVRRHFRHLSADPMRIVLGSTLMVCAPNLNSGIRLGRAPRDRTFVTTTEPLDPLYTPAFRVESRYERNFRPTLITDAGGAPNETLLADLLPAATPAIARMPEPVPFDR